MSGDLPASRNWNRVTRRAPCPICHKHDWCTVSADAAVACCMRVASSHQLKNGGWFHRLSDVLFGPPATAALSKPTAGLAPLDRRDRVYKAFIRELGLLPRHQDHLREVRGLPDVAFDRFASTPPRDFASRRHLARRIMDQLGDGDVLDGVPGFLVNDDGQWTCRMTSPGILTPVPDPAGRIQAFQVRFDWRSTDGPRYIWFSSRGMPGGASPKTPAAYWGAKLTSGDRVIITEGSLKAAVAAWHLRTPVVGVPGVSNWHGALEMLPRGGAVVIAFDSDVGTNPVVARHQLTLARALYWAGHRVALAHWDPQYKGIDDAILAGASIELNTWPGGSRAIPLQENPAPQDRASLMEARA
jgi:hypothetical protein